MVVGVTPGPAGQGDQEERGLAGFAGVGLPVEGGSYLQPSRQMSSVRPTNGGICTCGLKPGVQH